jgi:hypothetical protein
MMVFDALFALMIHCEVGDIHREVAGAQCEMGDIHREVGHVSRL